MIAIFGYIIFRDVLLKSCQKLIKKCKKEEEEEGSDSDTEEEIQSQDIFQELRLGWIDNYCRKAQEDNEDLINDKKKYKKALGQDLYI